MLRLRQQAGVRGARRRKQAPPLVCRQRRACAFEWEFEAAMSSSLLNRESSPDITSGHRSRSACRVAQGMTCRNEVSHAKPIKHSTVSGFQSKEARRKSIPCKDRRGLQRRMSSCGGSVNAGS